MCVEPTLIQKYTTSAHITKKKQLILKDLPGLMEIFLDSFFPVLTYGNWRHNQGKQIPTVLIVDCMVGRAVVNFQIFVGYCWMLDVDVGC